MAVDQSLVWPPVAEFPPIAAEEKVCKRNNFRIKN